MSFDHTLQLSTAENTVASSSTETVTGMAIEKACSLPTHDPSGCNFGFILSTTNRVVCTRKSKQAEHPNSRSKSLLFRLAPYIPPTVDTMIV